MFDLGAILISLGHHEARLREEQHKRVTCKREEGNRIVWDNIPEFCALVEGADINGRIKLPLSYKGNVLVESSWSLVILHALKKIKRREKGYVQALNLLVQIVFLGENGRLY
jgi:hypothetical protein